YTSPRDATNPNNGLDPLDYFETTLTTRGYLSNGVSENTTLFGGPGNDGFTVYRNKAELFLYGEEDDDSFRVRAFVKVNAKDPKAPYTNINGGQGADFISYTVNAPVRVEGGDGYDTLTVIGTEFGDDFVVTDKGVFGGGLYVTYSGVEKVVVDAQEGNDRFYIASTSEKVELQLVGGRGSDTFNIAGGNDGKALTVVSNSLEGHSGLIEHTISSDDGTFNATFVQDISASVADNDEAEAVVTLLDRNNRGFDGRLLVFESQPAVGSPLLDLVLATYQIVLTRSPEESVRITAAPIPLSEREQRAGGRSVMLNGSEVGVTLLFDRTNWFVPQTITVTGVPDDLAEGRRAVNIQHKIVEGASATDGGAYDGLVIPGVVADVIDDDAAELVIVESQGSTLVAEGQNTEDSYWAFLSKRPSGDVHVQVANTDNPAQVSATPSSLVFTTADWNVPHEIKVKALQDTAREGMHYSRLGHTISVADLSNYFGLGQSDVAKGLAAAVNGDLSQNFKVTVSASAITVSGPVAFTADFVGPLAGGLDVQGARALEGVLTATPAGPVVAGDAWYLQLNDSDFSYVAELGDTLAEVIAGLAADVNAYRIALAGQVTNNSVWTVVLDGQPFSYTHTTADPANLNLTNVAAGLRDLINNTGAPTFSATTSGGELIVKRTDGAAFAGVALTSTGGAITAPSYVAALVADTGAGQPGFTVQLASGQTVPQVAHLTHKKVAKAVTSLEVTPAEPVVAGDTWTITLDGSELIYTATGGENAIDVAAALEAAVVNGFGQVFRTNRTGSILTIERQDHGQFDAESTAKNGTLSGTASATHWAVVRLTMNETTPETPIARGDRWVLTLKAAAALAAQYQYVAGSNKESVLPSPVDVKITDDDVVGVLVTESGGATHVTEATSSVILGGGFVTELRPALVIGAGAQVTAIATHVTQPGGGESPTSRITIKPIAVAPATPRADACTAATLILSGGVEVGGVWSITLTNSIGSRTFSYTVLAGGTTLTTIAEQLLAQITAEALLGGSPVSGYTAALETALRFEGDFGASVLPETNESHDSRFTAQDIDLGKWNTNTNPDILDSTTKPHITIPATGDGETDFYKFVITEKMIADSSADGEAGLQTIFDIDYGMEEGDLIAWGSLLRLYNGNGDLIAQGRGMSDPSDGLGGSNTFFDDFLRYTFRTGQQGTYYIEVANSRSFGGLPQGVDYQLQVSIENHSLDSFIFGPDPVLEDENGNNDISHPQDLEDAGNTNWFTFFDSQIGNTQNPALTDADRIDFLTPYVKIQGAGDGSPDYYRFELKDKLFEPTLGDMAGTKDPFAVAGTTTYYVAAELKLDGTVKKGDVWTLGLRYRDYVLDHTFWDAFTAANPTREPTLADIAAGFQAKINADAGQAGRYTLVVDNDTLIITQPDEVGGGFNLTGVTTSGVTQEVQSAGSVLRKTLGLQNDVGKTPILFSDALVTVSGATKAGDKWTLWINASKYEFTAAGTDLSAVAAGLAAAVTAGGSAVVTATTDAAAIQLVGNAGATFSVAVGIEAASPQGLVSISGTPVQSQVGQIAWTDATFTLVRPTTVTAGDTWWLVLNGTAYSYRVTADDQSLDEIAKGLKNAVPASFNPTYNTSAGVTVVRVHRTAPFTAMLRVGEARVDAAQSFRTHSYALTGPAVAGDTWTLTLPGGTASYVVLAGDSLAGVALGLARAVNASPALVQFVAAADADHLAITRLASTAFTPSLVGTPVGTLSEVAGTTAKALALGGTVTVGDQWTVTVTFGTPETVVTKSATVATGETDLSGVAGRLQTLLEGDSSLSGFAIFVSGSTLTLTRPDDVAFTAALELAPAGQSTTASVAKDFTIGATGATNSTWTVTLNDGSALTATYKVAALDGVNDVADGLASAIDGKTGYTAVSNGATVTVIRPGSVGFTVTVTVDDAGVTPPTAAPSTTLNRVFPLTAFNSYRAEGDTWNLTVGAEPASYTLEHGDVLSDVLAGLKTSANAIAGFKATTEGQQIVLTRLDGSDFGVSL
ncbi:MAG: hypothetical protein NTU94_00225, partial [Planctomycetota bacterium]|nr:hypothetical protein [Planctomycetota bacterium]